MAKGRKNNSKPYTQASKPDSEYDLTRSMQRVRQYRPSKGGNYSRNTTKSDNGIDNERYLSNQSDNINRPTSEPARDYYFRLEDQMSDFNVKNEDAHNDLRKTFDAKISDVSKDIIDVRNAVNDKVSNSLFQWIIGGIIGAVVIIITIWATLSYLPLVQKTENHTESIHELDKRVNAIETAANPMTHPSQNSQPQNK